jgi:hypothetical protein
LISSTTEKKIKRNNENTKFLMLKLRTEGTVGDFISDLIDSEFHPDPFVSNFIGYFLEKLLPDSDFIKKFDEFFDIKGALEHECEDREADTEENVGKEIVNVEKELGGKKKIEKDAGQLSSLLEAPMELEKCEKEVKQKFLKNVEKLKKKTDNYKKAQGHVESNTFFSIPIISEFVRGRIFSKNKKERNIRKPLNERFEKKMRAYEYKIEELNKEIKSFYEQYNSTSCQNHFNSILNKYQIKKKEQTFLEAMAHAIEKFYRKIKNSILCTFERINKLLTGRDGNNSILEKLYFLIFGDFDKRGIVELMDKAFEKFIEKIFEKAKDVILTVYQGIKILVKLSSYKNDRKEFGKDLGSFLGSIIDLVLKMIKKI